MHFLIFFVDKEDLTVLSRQNTVLREIMCDCLTEIKALRAELKTQYKEPTNPSFLSQLKLPLRTKEEFKEFNESLKDKDNFSNAVSNLNLFAEFLVIRNIQK